MEIPVTRRDAALLQEQEREFTNEGAPAPGVVETDIPVARLDGSDNVATSEAAPNFVAKRESIASLKSRVRVAEKERDALATFTQEEQYLRACSLVDALERQLEERIMNSAQRELPAQAGS
jgi:hypothetical protein